MYINQNEEGFVLNVARAQHGAFKWPESIQIKYHAKFGKDLTRHERFNNFEVFEMLLAENCDTHIEVVCFPKSALKGIEYVEECDMYRFSKDKMIVERLKYIMHEIIPSSYVSMMMSQATSINLHRFNI
jgi:hypothetical protein